MKKLFLFPLLFLTKSLFAGGFIFIPQTQVLAAASGCSPAPVFISSTSHYAGSAATVSLTLAGVTAGDRIVIGSIQNTNSATLVRVTDNAAPTSTYTIVGSTITSAAPTKLTILVATANATGTLTITVTNSATVDSGAHAVDFQNVGSTDIFVGANATGSGTTFTSGAFSLALQNEALFALLGDEQTAITNISLTSTAATLTKVKDELSNTSSSAYGITSTSQSNKTFTATWTTASTGGAMLGLGLKGSCGI